MSTLLVDFSFADIKGVDIKNAGYSGVIRYLSSNSAKRITAAQRDDYFSNGLSITLVYEDDATAALGGSTQGIAHAQTALSQANALGVPASIPIYFAVDFNVTAQQMPVVIDYLKGVNSVIGEQRTGGYGSFDTIGELARASVISYKFQTLAWSGGQIDKTAHIYQNGDNAFNGNADVDIAQQNNFGQWSAPTSNQGGDEMTTENAVTDLFHGILHRNPTTAELAEYVNQPYDVTIAKIINLPEFSVVNATYTNGQKIVAARQALQAILSD